MACGCKKKKTEQTQTVTNTSNNQVSTSSTNITEEDKAKLVSEIIRKLNSTQGTQS